ncbi:hypothetical protein PTI98_004101 [Pleurotus ostreatus]|nr:hypothetical protein PTI98_004101 [Pleurotus ostreatus]
MSRYPLRNRTASQAAPSNGESELSSPHADPISLEPSPTLGASTLNNERSYADVAGARVLAANRSAADASRVGNDVADGGMSHDDAANPDAGIARNIEPQDGVNESDNGGQWIPVGRGCRRHSAPSIDRLRSGVSPISSNNTIDLAYENLTNSQRKILERRERLLRSNDPDVPEQRVEPNIEPSGDKGKYPDPRNWGDVDFDGENLDPEAQAEALKLYNLLLKRNKNKKLFQEPEVLTRNNQTDPPAVDPDVVSLKQRMAELEAENNQLRRLTRSSRTPVTEGIRDHIEKSTKKAKQKLAEPRISRKSNYLPSQQIPAGSFVGKALKSLADRKHHRPEDPDDSSESSSTSASSSNGSSDSSRNARRKKRSKKKRHAKKKGKSLLKPVPPKRYNGEANLTLVYRFMTESIAYLEQGEVDEEYWIRTIASFLEGTVYDFYAQQVSLNIAEWTIDEFFEGLIDTCFPADLLEQTRQEIDSFTQGSRSVKDYAAVLKQKFEIVGTIGEQERVVKLWNSMKSSIRAELYRERLNPNVSSWADVVAAAEMLEMVENVRYGRHNRRTPGSTGETGDGQDNKHRSQKGNRATRFRSDPNKGDRSTPGGPSGSGNHPPPWRKDPRPKNPHHRTDKGGTKAPNSLTTKELDELRKAVKCFRCRGDGHMAKECPLLDSVKSSNGSRPPGLPSHAVDIDFEAHEKLADQEDEVLHELEFNATHLHTHQGVETAPETLDDLMGMKADISAEDDMTKPPVLPRSWDKYVPMGDQALIACRAALEDLGKILGFPGDTEFPFPSRPRWHYRGRTTTRFSIRRISNSDALITDRWQNNRRTPIPYHLLWDPEFNLPHWYAVRCCKFFGLPKSVASCLISPGPIPDILREAAIIHLQRNTPFRGDEEFNLDHPNARFSIGYHAEDPDNYFIEDEYRNLRFMISRLLLANERFNLVRWYNKRLSELTSQQQNELRRDEVYLSLANLFYPKDTEEWIVPDPTTVRTLLIGPNLHIELEKAEDSSILVNVIDLHGQQIERGTYPALQRNAAITRDATRVVPKPIVVTVHINGHPVRALLDSGSLGDFLSTTVVEQLGLRKIELQTPLALQLAVQGSRSKINFGCKVQLAYQNSVSERYFDVANIANYDVILGLNAPQPLNSEGVTKLSSRSVQLVESNLEKAHTPFPPLRDINHTIPLIDENKVYHWHPARCPDPL